MNKIVISVDTEFDLHGNGDKGITEGLRRLEKICSRKKIKPILFVVGKVLEKHSKIFKEYNKKGWEISCHGYSHKRFDDLSYDEKEKELDDCIKVWKKILGKMPKGFRAPQHSIDKKTLDLLDKKGFEYDSSDTPLNFLQLLFFPSRIGNWFRHFFSSTKIRKIRKNLVERPVAGLGLPFVSLVVRILPVWMLKIFVWKLSWIYEEQMFYAHSWDFIELKNSKIDRAFSHERFIEKLDLLLK